MERTKWRQLRVAHASRVLVPASRRDELDFSVIPIEATHVSSGSRKTVSVPACRENQHAGRVRYPELAHRHVLFNCAL